MVSWAYVNTDEEASRRGAQVPWGVLVVTGTITTSIRLLSAVQGNPLSDVLLLGQQQSKDLTRAAADWPGPFNLSTDGKANAGGRGMLGLLASDDDLNSSESSVSVLGDESTEAVLEVNEWYRLFGRATQFEAEKEDLASTNLNLSQELEAYEAKMMLQMSLNAIISDKEDASTPMHNTCIIIHILQKCRHMCRTNSVYLVNLFMF